jgi:glycosyltransferase involved in cell wall biosynthesis
MKLISFVCTTYRRATCVERVIEQFIQQTYPEKELIIFNTDVEHPIELAEELKNLPITLINNDLDYLTQKPYTNRGAICRDAVTHATGEYFMLADDDDVYLPWHLEQAVDSIQRTGKDAWKPQKSIFATGDRVEFTQNTLEASVIVKMDRIREIGFRTDMTGYEGLSWYTKLRDEGQLNEHDQQYVPSYCFNWSDPGEISGHKQSGDINNPNNFENHKIRSLDFAKGPLNRYGQEEIFEFYSKYYAFLQRERENFPIDLWEKYAQSYISSI